MGCADRDGTGRDKVEISSAGHFGRRGDGGAIQDEHRLARQAVTQRKQK
jgi:hypothetical protein